MPRLFGTDGVRGVANRDLTPDLALALGRAAGRILAPGGGEVCVGRDTRISGPMLENALVAGLCSAGVNVRRLGVVPTPAVAFTAVAESLDGAAMVSASHNPVPDNGIKFFSADGRKTPEEVEAEIEALLQEVPDGLPEGMEVGTASHHEEGVEHYLQHLVTSIDGSLRGLKVVLDCAYGAAFHLGPLAFREAGAEVVAINDEPDGSRINVDCGSTSLGRLTERVMAEGAHLGLAFDGDADRVLAVDERGDEVDGDRLIAMCAIRMHEAGTLKNDLVVATVMANLGFRRALNERGIEVFQAPVGDKYVAQAMLEKGAVLGGEQSGHLIFSEFATTGDGILAGLQVARTLVTTGEPMSALAHVFEPVPQILVNVKVADKHALDGCRELWDEVAEVEAQMGDEGRVLLRPSGTEPVVRVMVEATDPTVAQTNAQRLVAAVERLLG
ncbi:MAG: phosphoglucosamine mutase [Actinomycetota bacterium]